MIATEDSTCQKEGYKKYKCSLCNDEYAEKIGKTTHTFVLASTKESSCTEVGAKQYKCSNCDHSYSEEIALKDHTYSSATCINPQTCTSCGRTEGTALGHSIGTVLCSRCGEVLFETLTYSGTGSKVITNIIIPEGNFVISGYGTSPEGKGSFYMYLKRANGRDAAYWIESFYSYETTIEKAEPFTGNINGGVLEIKVADGTSWTITIEAVGN